MSDFSQVTKYLDRRLVGRATTPLDLPNRLRGEPPSGTLARYIRKINTYITTPAFTFDGSARPQGILIFQCNFTVSSDFYVLNTPQVLPYAALFTFPPIVCIKYRIGTTAYRYRLPCEVVSPALNANDYRTQDVQATVYSNELIKKNFTIEFWQKVSNNTVTCPSLEFKLSMLDNPETPNDIENDVLPIESLTRADLVLTINPEVLPTPYISSSYWLTN